MKKKIKLKLHWIKKGRKSIQFGKYEEVGTNLTSAPIIFYCQGNDDCVNQVAVHDPND